MRKERKKQPDEKNSNIKRRERHTSRVKKEHTVDTPHHLNMHPNFVLHSQLCFLVLFFFSCKLHIWRYDDDHDDHDDDAVCVCFSFRYEIASFFE